MEAKLLIDGQWVAGGALLEVRNKYTEQVIGAVSTARHEDVDAAIAAAQPRLRSWPSCLPYKRSEYLLRTAAAIRERRDEFARTIAAEAGESVEVCARRSRSRDQHLHDRE
ncbi:MAG: aldehyde dehydrogenase family protein [Anaerolineae bacterium]